MIKGFLHLKRGGRKGQERGRGRRKLEEGKGQRHRGILLQSLRGIDAPACLARNRKAAEMSNLVET